MYKTRNLAIFLARICTFQSSGTKSAMLDASYTVQYPKQRRVMTGNSCSVLEVLVVVPRAY